MQVSKVVGSPSIFEKQNKRQDLGSISHSSMNTVNYSTTAFINASTTAFINNSTTASTTASTIASNLKNPKIKNTISIISSVLFLFGMMSGLKSTSKLLDKCLSGSKIAGKSKLLKDVGVLGLTLGSMSMPIQKKNLLNDEQIISSLTNTYNETCSKYGISKEDRPKVEVTYADKLYQIDGKGKVKSRNIPAKYERVASNGLYDSEKHVVKINGDICAVDIELEDAIAHELYHAKEAILRNSLPQEERETLVKKVLLDNIKKGDNITIIKTYDDKNQLYTTMDSPIISEKMKKPLADFAEKYLFANDDSLSKKMQEYYSLKYEVKDCDRTIAQNDRLEELSVELSDIIFGVRDLNQKGAIHKKSFDSIYTKKSKKEQLLFEYLLALENRYQYFKVQEQNFAVKELTPDERANIEKSISSNIQSVEGNVAFSNYRKSMEKLNLFQQIKRELKQKNNSYDLYFNSDEEYFARQSAKKERKEQLHKRLLNGENVRYEMRMISTQLRLEENMYKQHLATRNLRNNPENSKYKWQYFITSLLPEIIKISDLY